MTRIVVADDDRMLRKVAETTLRRQRYDVATASDGEEALQLIRSERPHMIVLDLIMPKLQGFDVLQTLKQDPLTSAIPVIVSSSLTQEQDKQEALDLGAVAYFNKTTFSMSELVKQVERPSPKDKRHARVEGQQRGTSSTTSGRTRGDRPSRL